MVARFALHRHDNIEEERALLEQLGNALAGLSAPWSVIVNEHLRQSPWVRYMVFHPDKGLALVDAASARPERKIGQVASLFTRAGFGAFEQGSLPLIAVSVGKFQIEALEFCLDTAFQATRCGLTIADWPEQAIALLLERSDMNLKRLGRTDPITQASTAEAATPSVMATATEAAIEEAAPITQASTAETTAPPAMAAAPEAAVEKAPPIARASAAEAATPPVMADAPQAAVEETAPIRPRRTKPVPKTPPFRTDEVRRDPPPIRLQAEPRRDTRAHYDLRHDLRPPKPRRRIRGAAAIAAGAAVVAYAYFMMPSSAPKNTPPVATQPHPTQQATIAPSAAPTPSNPVPPNNNKPVEETAMAPPVPVDTPPKAAPDIPAHATHAPPPPTPSAPTVAGRSVETLPPPLPSPAPLAPPPQSTQPEQLAAIPAPPPPKPHIRHHTTRAEDEDSPEPGDEVVMINGLPYVNGRQPHSLGTVKMPAASADEWNTWYGGE